MIKRLIVPLLLVAAVAAGLVLTVGRGASTGSAEAGPTVPALSVPLLDGSGEFELASLASADRPTLLWFWAPWCPICSLEAPKIEQLAAGAEGELDVVAIGGRDEVANGMPFIEKYGLRTPTILFDEAMGVWNAYRIPGQPGAVLLDREGRERGRWIGAFDPNRALEAARAL